MRSLVSSKGQDAAPAVSVIIPVFNGEQYIGEALDSVLGQTLAPSEIVVVDDGSTDGTGDRVRAYGDRVRYVTQENAGPTVARNHGVRLTSGPLIAFLDADDWWAPHKLEVQERTLSENPDLGFVVANVQNVWMEELADEAERYVGRTRGAPVPGYVTQALLVRRPVYDALGGFDESLPHTEIMDFFMRAEEAGIQGTCHPDTLVFRRMHEENLSRKESKQHLDEVFALLQKRVRSNRDKDAGADPDGSDPD